MRKLGVLLDTVTLAPSLSFSVVLVDSLFIFGTAFWMVEIIEESLDREVFGLSCDTNHVYVSNGHWRRQHVVGP